MPKIKGPKKVLLQFKASPADVGQLDAICSSGGGRSKHLRAALSQYLKSRSKKRSVASNSSDWAVMRAASEVVFRGPRRVESL